MLHVHMSRVSTHMFTGPTTLPCCHHGPRASLKCHISYCHITCSCMLYVYVFLPHFSHAGFVDPFDELASRSTRGPSTATTHHHTSSHPSHSFTDPLDALWGAGGPDPLGAHNAPGQPSHTGVSSSHAAHAGTGSGDGPSSHFWDFELSPPSTSTSPGPGDQPPPRTGGLPPPPPSAGASARHGGSTGDLLDLGFGGSSSSPGSVADRASSHEAVRGGSTSGPSHSRSSLTQPHTHAHAKSAGNLESMDGGTAGGTGGTDGDSLFGSTGSTGLSAGSKAGGQDGDGTTMGAALQTQVGGGSLGGQNSACRGCMLRDQARACTHCCADSLHVVYAALLPCSLLFYPFKCYQLNVRP